MPPVVAAVGGIFASASAWYAGLGIVGKALVQLGGSLLLSAASRALMPRPQRVDRRETIRQPVAPREMVYGRARKGGVIVFVNSRGSEQRDLDLVIVLAAHRVKSIGAIYFNGEMAVDASGTPVGKWAGADRVQIEKRLGGADQSAFDSSMDGKWSADHRLRSCAAIRLRLRYGGDEFPTGIPNITADVEGKDDILDPRTDLRGYSENVALCIADYMAESDFGLGAVIGEDIEPDALIEAANVCDEAVALDAGGTEPRYTCNGVISLSETPQGVIEGMLTAMAGHVVNQGGKWRIYAGAYRAPSVTLTEDDVRGDGLALSTRVSMRENFNGVRGQFISPENDWQPDDFPSYSSATYIAEDSGEKRWHDVALPFTVSSSMAQRLAKIRLEQVRRQQRVSFSGQLTALRAAAGETVSMSYDRWGFEEKPFDVLGVQITADATSGLVPTLTLRETSPLVYDWEASEEQIYAAAPSTNLPSPFDVSVPGVPLVTESLTESRGRVIAVARLEWVSAEGFVSEYEVLARRTLDADGDATGEEFASRGVTKATSFEVRDIGPGTWEFAVRAFSVLGVSSAMSVATVTIAGLSAPPQSLLGLTLQTAGGLAILKWQRSRDLDVRIGGTIVIRHSISDPPTWSNSRSMDAVSGSDAIAVVPLNPGTYLVRARDGTGNYGPVTTVATTGAQALAFAPITDLIEDPTFAGSKTNLVVAGGVLSLDDLADEGVYSFGAGMDFTTVKAARLRSDIIVEAVAVSLLVDDMDDPFDTFEDFDGTDGAEVDCVVEARTTPDDPAGTPTWSDWARIDSSEVEARAAEFRARVWTETDEYDAAVTRLRVHADEVA